MDRTGMIRFLQFFCIILFLVIIQNPIAAYAASADIVISSDKTEYSKGDTINIYIDMEAEVLPGDFEGYLLYQGDLLEYIEGNDIISGGEGILKIDDKVLSPTRNSRRYFLRFKAKGTGECDFFFSDTPLVYEFEEGYLMSVSVTELTINITAPSNASGDCSLAILKISPGTLEPGFSADIKEYKTQVPFSTEKLLVSAAAANKNANVSVTGNTELQYGNNRVVVTVTAENGDTAKYVIICERLGTSDDDNGSRITEGPGNDEAGNIGIPDGSGNVSDGGISGNTDSKSFGVKAESDGQDIKILAGKAYVLLKPEELGTVETELPSGYNKTSMKIDGIDVTVYASDSAEDFMLMPLKNEFGEAGLYSYDRLEKTIQRYKKRTDEKRTNVMTDSIEALELANSYEKSLNTMTMIIAILSGLSMALLIVVIRLALKRKNDELDD